MIDIETNLAAINAQIQQLIAKKPAGQPLPTLVAVSKKQPVDAIRQAAEAGQRHFGENYLQEAEDKIAKLRDLSPVWHFIGAIQSNKTAAIAAHFDWVHTVDRLKIAQRLSEQRPAGLPPINLLLQVNIDNDPAKAGVAPGEVLALAEAVQGLPRIELRGLMTITAAGLSATASAGSFARMAELFTETQHALGSASFDSLSMGMSGDWPLAVEAGANIIRVGTAIFGSRPA